MKKPIALMLSALLLLGALAGCGGTKEETPKAIPTPTPAAAPAATPTPAPTPEPTPEPPAVFTPDGSVIFEKDGLKITTAGLDVDPAYDDETIIWIDVENAGADDAYLGVANAAVNGFVTDLYLATFDEEDIYDSEYNFDVTVPAGASVRYGLSYNQPVIRGVDLSTLGELVFCFTLAEDEYTWPDFYTDPITIETGESVEPVDIAALGTVVIDDDTLLLVLGEQDYDEYLGPKVEFYAENRTDRYIILTPETAEADGVFSDYLYGSATIGPHQRYGARVMFDDVICALKSFEELTLVFSRAEAETSNDLDMADRTELDPVSVSFPPQIWGEYENEGYVLEVRPKVNALVTVETPENDENGVLFSVSETASMAVGGFEGAGWLFSIARVDSDTMHRMLCQDMSGAEVFARDYEGNYFICYTPTDVRFERATPEEMQRDAEQWSMLNSWAGLMCDMFIEDNGLEDEDFGNSEIDMLIARAAWDPDTLATISFLEPYGTVMLGYEAASPYAEFLLRSWFWEVYDEEAPDGEYMVMEFPEEDIRLDFFFAEGDYVRMTVGDTERLYQGFFTDDVISNADVVHGWYYEAAEALGLKQPNAALTKYVGVWAEEIAGRGFVNIIKGVAPDMVYVYIRWPESAAVEDTWEIYATPAEDGTLTYEDGTFKSKEYDENGDSWIIDDNYDEQGSFYFDAAGNLCWHNGTHPDYGDSVFIRVD